MRAEAWEGAGSPWKDVIDKLDLPVIRNAHDSASSAFSEPETAVIQIAVHNTAIMMAAVNVFRPGSGSCRLGRAVNAELAKAIASLRDTISRDVLSQSDSSRQTRDRLAREILKVAGIAPHSNVAMCLSHREEQRGRMGKLVSTFQDTFTSPGLPSTPSHGALYLPLLANHAVFESASSALRCRNDCAGITTTTFARAAFTLHLCTHESLFLLAFVTGKMFDCQVCCTLRVVKFYLNTLDI
jgi:hypothetical protein